MRVLIFGHGVVGKALANYLVSQECFVAVSDKDPDAMSGTNETDRKKLFAVSTLDVPGVYRLIVEWKPSIIVNASHDSKIDSSDVLYCTQNNILGDANLLHLAIHKRPSHDRIPVISLGWRDVTRSDTIMGATTKARKELFKAYTGLNLAKIVDLPCVVSIDSPSSQYMSIVSRVIDMYEHTIDYIVEYKGEDFYNQSYSWGSPRQVAKYIYKSFTRKVSVEGTFAMSDAKTIIHAMGSYLEMEQIQIATQKARRRKPDVVVHPDKKLNTATTLAFDAFASYIKMKNANNVNSND